MASNSNAKYDGDEKGIDMAWSSDIQDRKVKSSEGVEYATAPAEQQGEMSFDFLPEHVDVEELSEGRREILATAAMRDPDSIKSLAGMVSSGEEWTRRTLRDYWPEAYEQLRHDPSEAARLRHDGDQDGMEELDDEPTNDSCEDVQATLEDGEGFAPADQHELQRRVDEAILQCETLEKVHQSESELGRAARELRRTLEGDQ